MSQINPEQAMMQGMMGEMMGGGAPDQAMMQGMDPSMMQGMDPSMMEGMPLDAEAQEGRGGDTLIAHVTPGEIVIPIEVVSAPDFINVIAAAFAQAGVSIEQYTVGDPANVINPETGYPEFFFDDIFDTITGKKAEEEGEKAVAGARSAAKAEADAAKERMQEMIAKYKEFSLQREQVAEQKHRVNMARVHAQRLQSAEKDKQRLARAKRDDDLSNIQTSKLRTPVGTKPKWAKGSGRNVSIKRQPSGNIGGRPV
jgi:hypothetical protein